VIEGWNEVFRSRSWGRYPPEELVRFISRNFGSVQDRSMISILEVGCGPGANIWFLSREGYSVTSIDGSDVAISQAKNRLEKENLNVALHTGDVGELPFNPRAFDCVVDVACVYNNTYESSKKIIAEIHRVLKPDGLFFSKTFAIGTTGGGTPVEGELNTYRNFSGSSMSDGDEMIRLLGEEQIHDLHDVFQEIVYDSVVRTDRGRKHTLAEWLITCKK
jgi:SAM-dependent methyltransferase